eukprot:TRINITY_DN1938_c0_g1_i7.p1 TRINITY_DN1938_c0_g1~~TRINITY_DN1938_c0_g1_i7.p1  ORF type:complete len:109 (+),score=5.75 TRINITY_DN1938_c0_g1_i7:482-808(+)
MRRVFLIFFFTHAVLELIVSSTNGRFDSRRNEGEEGALCCSWVREEGANVVPLLQNPLMQNVFFTLACYPSWKKNSQVAFFIPQPQKVSRLTSILEFRAPNRAECCPF